MRLPAIFKNLNKRERYGIMLAAAAIGIVIIAVFIVEPFLSRSANMKKSLRTKADMLAEMQRMQSEYSALTQLTRVSESRFQDRQKGFTLFSFLDRLAGESGIKDNISYMKPSKTVQKSSPYKISRVEMKLDAITLEQLTDYLHGVETSKNMVDIKKISISKKDDKQGLLTAVLQVETVEI
ncbi:MAG: type II secretion system protein GspM [Desulfobacteraceae bacterium]|jgi:general secretion pathway protein M|nr:type II secretion system protein GspM [Desulfobacteraceae bacterium]